MLVTDRPPQLAHLSVLMEPPAIQYTPREKYLQDQLICMCIANGESTESTARKLGIGTAVVERAMTSPQGQEMIVKFQHEVASDPRARLQKMVPLALDVQTKILLSDAHPTVKAKVANEVLDRANGKATQVIESRSMHFDLKDAVAVEKALVASQEKLKRIEDMQKMLSVPDSARPIQTVTA